MTEPARPPPLEQPPMATGAMSAEGVTTDVLIDQPQLDGVDKKIICAAMCKCQNVPNIGKDKRSLKQECVSSFLKELDAKMEHRSSYKPEFTFDMTKRPPAPLLDKAVETKSKTLFPGWTNIIWPKDPEHPPYKANLGYTRRPDVVIVKDATKPPTQDKIKQVVEIKFPNDEYRPRQLQDYIKIAGDRKKMVTLKLDDCDCDKSEPDAPKGPVDLMAKATALLGLLYVIVMKKPPPRGLPVF